jgi:type I restriction enzyme M protein
MTDVVQKLWGFCNTLRHDGIDYGDYIEQLTYLLFLKMADERGIALPEDCDWPSLEQRSGTDLGEHYIDLLRRLGNERGLLGDIFAGAQSRFNNPVNLRRLVSLIDETDWTALNIDIKAAAFEGLLEKAASEGKKGASQYFTPRPLIEAIVRCMKPDPRANREFSICDPACGTGGFLVASYEWLIKETGGGAMERDLAERVRHRTYYGKDLVQRPRRLASMNLYLHGLEAEVDLGDSIYEAFDGTRHDVVMTNPPFGTKGANQAPDRDEFVIATSNKQLNFVQHVMTMLKPGGRAAVVVPDNCLFADQAGEVFKVLTEDCNLHTVLRLANGTFSPYSAGTKTNVIFFQKGPPTDALWIYDGRTNIASFTKKERQLTPTAFAEFERCYGSDPNGRAKREPGDSGEDRWRRFEIHSVRTRDFKIDSLKWLREEFLEDGDDLAEPEELATEAMGELEAAVAELKSIVDMLENGAEAAALERAP